VNAPAKVADDAVSGTASVHDELDALRTCATALEPLGNDARTRILNWLIQRYGGASSQSLSQPSVPGFPNAPAAGSASPEVVTPKRFVQDKAPKTDVERVAVLAYYLSRFRGTERFQTSDLTELNTEAAQPRFSNAANTASNAVKSTGLFTDAGKGLRQLTLKGEELVEALPSRDAVKAVTEKYGSPRRRRAVRPVKGKDDED
jgi:hypothetical protein